MFLEKTCGCKLNGKKPCSSLFVLEYLLEIRAQAALLGNEQLDLGRIMAGMNKSEDVVWGPHKPAKRQRMHTEHTHTMMYLCAPSLLVFSMTSGSIGFQ